MLVQPAISMLDSEMNNNKIDKEVCGEETEDTPTLSAETLKALLEFYAENQADGEDKTKIVEDWVTVVIQFCRNDYIR